MSAPTYDLRHVAPHQAAYLDTVRQLTDWVLGSGSILRSVTDAYAEFVELNGRESRRSDAEYLLEALMLGVLWRSRGREAMRANERQDGLVTQLVRERRSGAQKRRDGTATNLIDFVGPWKRGRIDPTLHEIEQLLDWMLATGEYDDEHARLEGWKVLLATTQPATNREILRLIVAFAVSFEAKAIRMLGRFTHGVDRFLIQELPMRASREDAVQCSSRRAEYHLNMVGAEVLNRAWRSQFENCHRHVVVLPGCARQRGAAQCRASGEGHGRRCNHCTLSCIVSAATRLAERTGHDVVTVLHGSEFAQSLDSSLLDSHGVGVIGVACVSGLIGAGWRARARGNPAQCVLLNAAGCSHWRDAAVPTGFELSELARILESVGATSASTAPPRVA